MPKILFTAETAANFARLSHIARKQPKPSELAKPEIPQTANTDDDYRKSRLMRVRLQLDRIDEEITAEVSKNPDGKRLKELVEAQNRLDAQEWSLANRHKPSVSKPSSTPTKRRQTFAEPIPLSEPGPAVQEVKIVDPFSEVQLGESNI